MPSLLAVNAGDTGAIYDFCRSKGITRSAFLQVAWAMMLSRWLEADQPCFGYLASGRDMPIDGIEDMVGPLINMLIARVDLTVGLDEILKATSRDSIKNLSHQHVSVAEIQHELGNRGQQLFNITLTVHNNHIQKLHADGLQLEERSGDDPHEVRNGTN